MLKTFAIAFGVVFLIIGVLGFIPAVAPAGMLFGLFEVGPLHNLVHILTGAIGLAVAAAGERASRLYFQVFGVVYALLTVFGVFYGDAALLGVVTHNWADVWLHLAIALVALYLGFGYRRQPEHRRHRPVTGRI
jgi:hypothetical protein